MMDMSNQLSTHIASPNPSQGTLTASPIKVIQWGIPKSLSTVFLKSMSQVEGVQIMCELYTSAYEFGPERKVKADFFTKYEKTYEETSGNFTLEPRQHLYDDSICTYKWVRETLESNFPEKNVIFTKEFAYALEGQYDMLPSGFQHTILIRHPQKSYTSWKKMYERFTQTTVSLDAAHASQYQTLYELMEYTQLHGQPNPIVIDADDLQRHPESILRQYCEATNIPYNPRLLEWDAGDDILHTMVATNNTVLNGVLRGGMIFSDALESTKFKPSTSKMSKSDIPTDLLDAIENSMQFYDKMYALRIKP